MHVLFPSPTRICPLRTISELENLPFWQLTKFFANFWKTTSPDVAICMYYTGLDPFTNKPVSAAKGLCDRKLQRALMQFFKPANYFEAREALLQAGRADLIGNGCDCPIPANPPNEALEAKRKRANADLTTADHYHTVPTLEKNRGYRPGRKTHKRQ
jgi:hypothetical protein